MQLDHLAQGSVGESETGLNLPISQGQDGEVEEMLRMSVGDKQNQEGTIDIQLLKCDLCNFKTTKKDDLKRHLIVHEGLMCQLCDFVGYRQTVLDAHMEHVHKQVQSFKCDLCTYSTSRKVYLSRHVKSYHNSEEIAHGNGMDSSNLLESKIMTDAPTKNSLSNNNDMQPMGAQSQARDAGGYTFTSMVDHQWLEELRKTFLGYTCPLCPFLTTTKSIYNDHLLTVHEIIALPNWEDAQPEMVTKSREEVNSSTHATVTAGSNIAPKATSNNAPKANSPTILHCTICSFSTEGGREALKDHQRTAHKEINFKYKGSYKYIILNCSRCEFTTRNGSKHLKDHENRVHDGVFFRCDQCGKSFGRKSGVMEHTKRVHQGINKFKCAICEVPKFEKKQVLKHIRDFHPEVKDNPKVEALIIRIPER